MNHVEIYTSDTCVYCHAAKNYLSEHKIDFVEHDITTDMEARKALMKKGYRSVPVIIIDGEEIAGFDEQRIAEKLNM